MKPEEPLRLPARGKEFALIERGSNEAIPIRSA